MAGAATGPDWLGSPQHVVAGAVLAAAVVFAARRAGGLGTWIAIALAVGATCTAELVVELVEYPLLYADRFHRTAYYDTLADMASTIVGGVVAAALAAVALREVRGRPS